jgi:predicted nuclease of restriction endonuclease-like (RecB) superfamily
MKKRAIAQNFSPEHSDYQQFLLSVRELVDNARYHVFKTTSNTQVQLYWMIGEGIVRLQDKHGWGDAIVENLSQDLRKCFPDSVSFSARNLWLMRQMYTEYRDLTKKLKQAASEIPWWQNVVIIQKVKALDERRYYLQATRDMGWSRNVLLHQIKGKAYQRHRSTGVSRNRWGSLNTNLPMSFLNRCGVLYQIPRI